MIKKTSELTGIALDWAVMTALGFTFNGKHWTDGQGHYYKHDDSPSSNWAQGGPIIEREGITVGRQVHRTEWSAEAFDGSGMSVAFLRFGPTPLIAAMRCYATSKLGDEVDVPNQLCTPTKGATT